MITVTIIIASASLCAWLYLLLCNGRFWSTRGLLLPFPGDAPLTAMRTLRVAVVIPARNEQETITRAVRSLLAQNFPGELHIFLVSDHCTDHTDTEARRAAGELGAPVLAATGESAGIPAGARRSLTILNVAALPAGWSGKMWAVHQGVEQALAVKPGFLLLTDADIEHAPASVASLVAKADGAEEAFDMVSLMVRLHCRSLAERLLIPAFVFFFFMLYPPCRIANPRRRMAGAAGGCILIRPVALARAGGIEAIRGEIIDDCALARHAKQTGSRLFLGLANETASIRPYDTFAEIGRMISRTAFNQLRHSALLLAGSVAGLALVYLAPVALLFAPVHAAQLTAFLALVLMCAVYAPMVRFYRQPPWWTLTLPAAALFYLGATVHSALNYWQGRGGQWKGRAQDHAA